MPKKNYPEEIIKKAKELWEGGTSYPKIAEQLEIDRWMTVYDWKRKQGWIRSDSSNSDSAVAELWEEIGEKALAHLLDGEFTSMTEAMRIHETALRHIRAAKKTKEEGDSKGGVLRGLELVEDEKIETKNPSG